VYELLASAARTASGNFALPDKKGELFAIDLLLTVTAQAGTTPTLNVALERRLTGSVWEGFLTFAEVAAATPTRLATWVRDVAPAAVERAPVAPGAAGALNGPAGSEWRLTWAIAGGSPSYTFSVHAEEYFASRK